MSKLDGIFNGWYGLVGGHLVKITLLGARVLC